MKTLKSILQCLLEWAILCSVIAIVSLLRIIPVQPPKRSSTPDTNKAMKRKPKAISREKAIVTASNHNHIPIQITKGYTESELGKHQGI